MTAKSEKSNITKITIADHEEKNPEPIIQKGMYSQKVPTTPWDWDKGSLNETRAAAVNNDQYRFERVSEQLRMA